MRRMAKSAWQVTTAGLLLASFGCNFGGGGDEPMANQRFAGVRSPTESIAAPVDQPGPLMYDQVRVELREHEQARLGGVLVPREGRPEPVREVSPEVSRVVADTADAATRPTTAPATRPTAEAQPQLTPGQYYTIGGVVAEVNGEPIYANRVLNILARPLQAKAHEADRQEFAIAARDLIDRQIEELVRAEVLFAAAQRNLSAEEKLLADSMTMAWRNNQITDAGGSLQQAVRRAADRGEDFEQLLQEQYRQFMTQVYVQKKLMPRVQLTASDLRRFYDSHLDQFTQFDEATFRIIRIDPRKMDSREAALDKITTVWRQLQRGEVDFAEVAGQVNQDRFLLESKGLVPGPIQRGSYREQLVEDAVWNTPVGGLTEIITGKDGAFYVAKVESKREGRVMAFEEEKVQDAIRATLRSEQLRALMDQARERLARNASVRRDRNMIEIAVEMANQNYDRWRASTLGAPDAAPTPAPQDVVDTLLPPDADK